jgi:peptidoglycan/xylan/chitin deacetylase (PgdA/CDA1 family)
VSDMKLSTAGFLTTAIVIALGVIMIAPIFARTAIRAEPLKVVLIFSVKSENSTLWCEEVGSCLATRGIHASVFFSGKAAEQGGISEFKDGVDIGSMTYNYLNLTSVLDYSLQLEEIARGKLAVDSAGSITSRAFMAPYGSVNEDIYSLLERVGVVADFSYNEHYNKVYEGQFIRMELQIFDYYRHTADYYLSITDKREPVVIKFDDSAASREVTDFISHLASGNVIFLNVSELTGLQLTLRS